MSQGTQNLMPRRVAGAAILAALVLVGCQKEAGETPATATQPEATQPAPAAPAAETAATGTAPAAAIPEDLSVAEMLAAAREALTADRVVTPAGNSAMEYYVGVLAREPNNPTAGQALVDIFPMAVSVAEREISERRLEEAVRIVDLLDRASPNSFSVRSLRERMTAARDADSRAQLAQEQERQLRAAEAARVLAEQQAAEAPAPVAEVPAEPAPQPEPEPEPAPAPPPVAQPVAATPPPPAGETRAARSLRQVQPGFPTEAARRRQEGWVELSFTIGVDGRVSNVSVERSQPPRVFDREAISAMQQWTFEPALRDGQPIPSRGARRMEFRL